MVQLTPEASDRIAGCVCHMLELLYPAIQAAVESWGDAGKRIGNAANRVYDAALQWENVARREKAR